MGEVDDAIAGSYSIKVEAGRCIVVRRNPLSLRWAAAVSPGLVKPDRRGGHRA